LDENAATKLELFYFLRAKQGFVFVNEDDSYLKSYSFDKQFSFRFGIHSTNLNGKIVENSLQGMKIEIRYEKWYWPEIFETHLYGDYNASNVLAAIAVGLQLNVSISKLKQGISSYIAANNRSQFVQKGRFSILLDAYNANPSSMQAAIQNFFLVSDASKALILGDMLELGAHSQAEHEALGKLISSYNPRCVVFVGAEMKHAAHILSKNVACHWFPDTTTCGAKLPTLLNGCTEILLKGSRGMKLETLLEKI